MAGEPAPQLDDLGQIFGQPGKNKPASSMDFIWEKSVLRLSEYGAALPLVLFEIAAGPAVDDGLVILDGLIAADWDDEERDPAPAGPADRVRPLR